MSINFLLLVVISVVLGAPLAMGVLTSGVSVFLFVIAVWIVAVCLHEYGHAVAADAGGDYTVQSKGYLSLDPVRYADPVTSLVIPVAILALGGIGFPGAAVYIRHDLLRSPLWQSGVALAGPAMTAVAMVVLALPFAFGVIGAAAPAFQTALAMLVFLQATALILNLLPVPGLDGYGVIEPFLPQELKRAIEPVRNYAFLILFALLIFVPGAATPLFMGSFTLLNALGVPAEWVFEGLQAFKFWEA